MLVAGQGKCAVGRPALSFEQMAENGLKDGAARKWKQVHQAGGGSGHLNREQLLVAGEADHDHGAGKHPQSKAQGI